MNDLLVRFCTYDYLSEDKFENPHFICAYYVESYDRFFNFINAAKGKDIILKDVWYTIDDIVMEYGGDEDFAFYMNVYCLEY